jgi:hypothetical protein
MSWIQDPRNTGDKPALSFHCCMQKGKNVDDILQDYIDILLQTCR